MPLTDLSYYDEFVYNKVWLGYHDQYTDYIGNFAEAIFYPNSYYDAFNARFEASDFFSDTALINAAALTRWRSSYRDSYVRNVHGTFTANTDVATSGGAWTLNVSAGHKAFVGQRIAFWNRKVGVAARRNGTITGVGATTITFTPYTLGTTAELITVSNGDTFGADWGSQHTGAGSAVVGAIPAWQTFTHGLTQDWQRNADTTSRDTVVSLCSNAAYHGAGYTSTDLTSYISSREVAYVIMSHLNAAKCGLSLDTTKVDYLKDKAIAHIDEWLTVTSASIYTNCRPFMVAITCRALLQYIDERGASAPTNAAIWAKLVSIADFLWTNCWNASAGAMKYGIVQTNTSGGTSDYGYSYTANPSYVGARAIDGVSAHPNGTDKDTGDDQPTPALNLMIAPLYWRLAKQYSSQSYMDKGDALFNGGVSVYSAGFAGPETIKVRGAYLGIGSSTDANNTPVGKDIGQQWWWITDGFDARNTASIPSSSTGGTGRVGYTKYITTLGGYYAPASSSASYAPSTFYSGATEQFYLYGSSTSKVLNAAAGVASNGQNVATWNAETGSVSLTQGTDANRPALLTGITNSKSGLTFAGSPDVLKGSGVTCQSIVRNTTKVSFGCVFKLNSVALNGPFMRLYDSSFSFNRIYCGVQGAFVALQAQNADSTAPTVVNTTQTMTLNSINAVLWEWDVAAGTATVWLNNAATSISGTAVGTAGTVANTASADQDFGSLGSFDILEMFLYTGALISNRTGWFAAAKSHYGLVTY